MAQKKRIYRIIFVNQGKVYEIYARNVSHGDLFGFVEIEEILFGEKTTLVVDPSEEALQQEFSGVERTYIPLHSVVRIDHVEKRGASRIHQLADAAGKVAAMPTAIYTPLKRDS